MNPPPSGPAVEEAKRRARAQHRERIQDAFDKAKLCREQYDQQRARGEVADELYQDMFEAGFKLYMEIRPAVLSTSYREDVSELGPIFHDVARADESLTEMSSVTPKRVAMALDRLTAVAKITGLAEVEA